MPPSSKTKWHKNKLNPFVRLTRRIRLLKLQLLRINDPPERIARGIALGVVCGIAPTFGFGGFVAFGLSFIFKANKAASILGSFIMNPITTPFFWSLSIILGSSLLGVEYKELLAEIQINGFVAGFSDVYILFMLGNSIIATVLGFLSYHTVKKGIIVHRRLRAANRADNGR